MEKTDADLVSKKPYLSEVLDYPRHLPAALSQPDEWENECE